MRQTIGSNEVKEAAVAVSSTPIRDELVPYMKAYDAAFSDSGPVNWSPFTIFFHPPKFRSEVVNTDELGFRKSIDSEGFEISAASDVRDDKRTMNIIAGSSTVFGIGASRDAHTLASLLSSPDRTGQTWLNFGGRSFNAIQEYILAAQYYHRLPPRVKKIVLVSGFNNLGLSRQSTWEADDHGTFFMWQRYQALAEPTKSSLFDRLIPKPHNRNRGGNENLESKNRDEQIRTAAETVGRALSLWTLLARGVEAELIFVLQPLANWVRSETHEYESQIFQELDRIGGFTETYGDILTSEVHEKYSGLLENITQELGIRYIDSVPLFRDTLGTTDWAYVDRIHFTDLGHEKYADGLMSKLYN